MYPYGSGSYSRGPYAPRMGLGMGGMGGMGAMGGMGGMSPYGSPYGGMMGGPGMYGGTGGYNNGLYGAAPYGPGGMMGSAGAMAGAGAAGALAAGHGAVEAADGWGAASPVGAPGKMPPGKVAPGKKMMPARFPPGKGPPGKGQGPATAGGRGAAGPAPAGPMRGRGGGPLPVALVDDTVTEESAEALEAMGFGGGGGAEQMLGMPADAMNGAGGSMPPQQWQQLQQFQQLQPGQDGALVQQQQQAQSPVQQQQGAFSERRRFIIGATLEIVTHLCQVAMHSLRSMHELISVCAGSYYGFQALRGLAPYLTGRQPMNANEWTAAYGGVPPPGALAAPSIGPVASGSAAPGTGRSRVRDALLLATLSVVLYYAAERLWDQFSRRVLPPADEEGAPLDDDGTSAFTNQEGALDDADADSTSDRAEGARLGSEVSSASVRTATPDSSEVAPLRAEGDGNGTVTSPNLRPQQRRAEGATDGCLFEALHAYGPSNASFVAGQHLAFAEGERLWIDEFHPGAFCYGAKIVQADDTTGNSGNSGGEESRSGLIGGQWKVTARGYIPGNYVQIVRPRQKF